MIGRGAVLGAVTVEDGARIGHGAVVADGVKVYTFMCVYDLYVCMNDLYV